MSATATAWLLLLLALLGLVIAVYFTLIYYHVIRPDGRGVPALCRLGEKTCQSVVFTRYGRLTGLPNSLWGILFYLLVLHVGLERLSGRPPRFLDIALAAALLTVVLAIYLVHALLVRLKVPCAL
jgi:uncharacterized membrane protein